MIEEWGWLQRYRRVAGMQGDCRDAGWLQGCRVAAGMQGGCRDAKWLQGCNCYSCGGGVIAEMGRVAGMQDGCRAAEELQGWGWLQGCRVAAGMPSSFRDAAVTAAGMG